MFKLITLAIVLSIASAGSPDLSGWAAVLTAVVGALAFTATLVRGRRNQKKVDRAEKLSQEAAEHTAYIKGFEALTHSMRAELTRLTERHDADKNGWIRLQERLEKEIEACEEDRLELRGELINVKGRVDLMVRLFQVDDKKAASKILKEDIMSDLGDTHS